MPVRVVKIGRGSSSEVIVEIFGVLPKISALAAEENGEIAHEEDAFEVSVFSNFF